MSPKTIPSAPRDSAAIPAWCAGSRGWPLTASASGPDGLRLAGEESGADRAAEIAELGEEHRRWAVVREDVGEHRVLEPLAIRVAETHAEPAAEHDRLDVEQVHRRGDAGAERRDGAVDEPPPPRRRQGPPPRRRRPRAPRWRGRRAAPPLGPGAPARGPRSHWSGAR